MTSHCLEGLKSARLKAGIEPTAAAEIIGVDVRSYYRYERGERLITFDKVCRLADAFGTSTDALRRSDDTVVAEALAGWDAEAVS